MRNYPGRVFIGLCEIVGYNSALKRGFDQLGVDSSFVELSSHPFKYGGNQLDNFWIRLIKSFGDRRSSTPRRCFIRKSFWVVCQQILTIPLFIWAVCRYDVFIFAFGESFFRLLDLPLLKLLGKKVICVFFGSESRPPYINGKYAELTPLECARLSGEFKRRVRRIERYADVVVNHPPTAHFHEKPFVQFMAIGIPTAIDPCGKQMASKARQQSVRVLHAPSHSACKGTDRIRSAVERLRARGLPIDYVEVMNQPNAIVIQELHACDFVIDELYSDAVMAGFATEAAFCGKPAIVGGYATAADWGQIPPEAIPPVHHCHPDQVEEAIAKLVEDEEYRRSLGEQAQRFVMEQWSMRSVASRFVKLIEGDVPERWYVEPGEVTYLHGWGLREEAVRQQVGKVVQAGGAAALQVADKPRLQALFLDFASKEAR